MKSTFVILSFLFLENIHAQTPIKNINWLLGSWTYHTKTYTVTESWKQASDTLFIGSSLSLRVTDTLAFEKSEIIFRNEKLIFNSVRQSSITPFALLSQSEDSVTFENVGNNFPQRFTYKKINTNKIQISLEGNLDGHLKHRDFFYDRILK